MLTVIIDGVRYQPLPDVPRRPGDRPGLVVRRAREHLKVSVQALADRVGCNPNTLYDFESGRRCPRFEILCAIAQALGLSLDTIAGQGAP